MRATSRHQTRRPCVRKRDFENAGALRDSGPEAAFVDSTHSPATDFPPAARRVESQRLRARSANRKQRCHLSTPAVVFHSHALQVRKEFLRHAAAFHAPNVHVSNETVTNGL